MNADQEWNGNLIIQLSRNSDFGWFGWHGVRIWKGNPSKMENPMLNSEIKAERKKGGWFD